MSTEELQNSPLHGLSAEVMLTELVEFYGWRVLDAAIDLKCFRIQPTIPSALAFLKKAEWARNRVEEFYLYTFKQMPKSTPEEMELKPRERGFPKGVRSKEPKPLTAKQALELRPVDESRPVKKQRTRSYQAEILPETPPEESTFKSRFSR
ncbi:VF530 family DNA-binding protein [Pontiellaceae bacterium B12227]|nr:VF530 family DNA-binding protein [Pontiellaceae bacterium B12227]